MCKQRLQQDFLPSTFENWTSVGFMHTTSLHSLCLNNEVIILPLIHVEQRRMVSAFHPAYQLDELDDEATAASLCR